MPLACLLVALAALVAVLATRDPEDDDRERTAVVFPDTAGLRWQSLEEAGPLRLAGEGGYWLAFRAFALGRATHLEILGDDGTQLELPIDTSPRIHFAGPLHIDGRATYFLRPDEAHGRTIPVFLASYALTRRPLAAFAGRGFWSPQFVAAEQAYASWLNTRGVIDLASRDRALARVWVTFNLTSIDDERTVTITHPGGSQTARAPERGANRRVTVGPVPLTAGQAQIQVTSPGPRIYGKDPRRRTVRLSAIEAHASPPSG